MRQVEPGLVSAFGAAFCFVLVLLVLSEQFAQAPAALVAFAAAWRIVRSSAGPDSRPRPGDPRIG